MSYDPQADPRWIPPDIDVPFEIDSLIQQYEEELSQLDAIEKTMASEGWALIAAQWKAEAERLDAKAQRESDPQQWFLLRGQATTLWYLLDLHDRVTIRKRRVSEDYRRFVGEEE